MARIHCDRVLGQGAFSYAFRSSDGDVVLIRDGPLSQNERDYFQLVQQAPPTVKRHFVQLKRELTSHEIDLKDCKLPHLPHAIKIEYGGKAMSYRDLTPDLWQDMMLQLFPAIAYMQDQGMFHDDVHMDGNILRDGPRFVIVDYGNAKRSNPGLREEAKDMKKLLSAGAPGIKTWLSKVTIGPEKSVTSASVVREFRKEQNKKVMEIARSLGFSGTQRASAMMYLAWRFPHEL